MTRHFCTRCREAISNGEGHIRTENFRQVAWCDLCWLLEHHAYLGPAVVVPEQRPGAEIRAATSA